MSTTKNKVASSNGLLLGIFLVLNSIILITIGRFEENKALLTCILALLVIFSFRAISQGKKQLGNSTFGASFSTGFKTSVIGAVMLAFFTFIYYTFFGEEILANLVKAESQHYLDMVAEMKPPQEVPTEKQIAEGLENLKRFMTPKSLSFKLGFLTIILGAITTLVTTTISELISMKNAK